MRNLISRIFKLPKQVYVSGLLKSGFVTPESEGSIQACLDHPYPSLFTKREYEIEETLQVNNPKKLIYGNGTTIKPIRDIDVLKINAGWVTGRDINIETNENHTKAGILYDSNFRIWGGLLDNVRIVGKREAVRKTGFGTKAFKVETQKIRRHAYVTHINFTNCSVEYCAAGLDIDDKSDIAKEHKMWVNTFDFDFRMSGCKEYLNLWNTDINSGRIIRQDEDILTEGEKDLFAINVMGSSRRTDIVYFPFDFHSKERGYYRHKGNAVRTNGDLTIKIRNIYLEKIADAEKLKE